MTRHPEGLINRLLGRSDIFFGDELYMERWRFFSSNTLGVGLRLHHIMRSDNAREVHDHPFDFSSLILRGGYWEWRPIETFKRHTGRHRIRYSEDGKLWARWYGPGSVVHRKAEDLHRLELPKGATTWTLVKRGPIRRAWGFQDNEGRWTRAEDYNETRNA